MVYAHSKTIKFWCTQQSDLHVNYSSLNGWNERKELYFSGKKFCVKSKDLGLLVWKYVTIKIQALTLSPQIPE